ncbi:hypothetical protein [Paenibacillus sp. HW567]|uniref:hypothetical protein n=1 Tax=Paenibacillus sp. HW567 TaxID=1034769 RepID=UPI00036DD528|nr:hypothetical protein [Paenibacillus sp. HW567]
MHPLDTRKVAAEGAGEMDLVNVVQGALVPKGTAAIRRTGGKPLSLRDAPNAQCRLSLRDAPNAKCRLFLRNAQDAYLKRTAE